MVQFSELFNLFCIDIYFFLFIHFFLVIPYNIEIKTPTSWKMVWNIYIFSSIEHKYVHIISNYTVATTQEENNNMKKKEKKICITFIYF